MEKKIFFLAAEYYITSEWFLIHFTYGWTMLLRRQRADSMNYCHNCTYSTHYSHQ
jgi:hypothetical protein